MPKLSAARMWASVPAAALCLAVSWIHVQDQGGFPGNKTPGYVAAGYYLLEAAGVIAAGLLLLAARRGARALPVWLLAACVGIGPLVGYVLSRGPGLPDYSDDKGNWAEPLGLVSLVVEAALIAISLAVLRTAGGGARGQQLRAGAN
ncbi:hypothetical protein [Streptomyces silvisoli]|uniref:DUF4345 domain-containing protein n=1 Tax=Streptomyces silvisoli TaxID=3034235 RepID=A0ABT5ZG38_9ACTN|nr:hypothetical protein [Streptomyces silvisoli]MDF3287963.1 hypothetical protein [Streptomyces silvisoli]